MKRLLPVFSAIGLRYSAIIIQFGIVAVLARRASPAVAGSYFVLFGWVNATYFLAGFGLPDGLLREISERRGRDTPGGIYHLVYRSAGLFILLSLGAALICAVAALAAGVGWPTVILSSAWWMCYALTFFAAQVLLALGRQALGSFFFYPALNCSLLVSLLPYLLLAPEPTLPSLLLYANLGAIPMALASLIVTARTVGTFRRPDEQAQPVPVRRMMGLGIQIAIARVAQTALYWVPTWFAGLTLGPAAAAVLGLAGRLNNAVNAVMAAIRFVVRPQIVIAAVNNDWRGIAVLAKSVNGVAALTTTVGALVYLAVGKWILPLFFGTEYEVVYWPLAILLLGTLAEAAGGIVDEILKLTGSATYVLSLLCTMVAAEVMLCWILAPSGILALAGAQAMTISVMYALYVAKVYRTTGILLTPRLALSDTFRRLRSPV